VEVDTLGDFEPVQRTKMRGDMLVFGDKADNTAKAICYVLESWKAGWLRYRELQ